MKDDAKRVGARAPLLIHNARAGAVATPHSRPEALDEAAASMALYPTEQRRVRKRPMLTVDPITAAWKQLAEDLSKLAKQARAQR